MSESFDYSQIQCLTVAQASSKGKYAYYGVYRYSLALQKKDKKYTWRKGDIVTEIRLSAQNGYITSGFDGAVKRAKEYARDKGLIFLSYVRHNNPLTPEQCIALNISIPEYLIPEYMAQKLRGEV